MCVARVWVDLSYAKFLLAFARLAAKRKNHKNVAANNNGNWLDLGEHRNALKAALVNNELAVVKKENVIARFLDTFCLYFFSFLLILEVLFLLAVNSPQQK